MLSINTVQKKLLYTCQAGCEETTSGKIVWWKTEKIGFPNFRFECRSSENPDGTRRNLPGSGRVGRPIVWRPAEIPMHDRIGTRRPDLWGIIVCSKDSPFLLLWASSFLDDYRVRHWAYNSGIVPTKLANRFPNLVHVEPERLHRPSYTDLNSIWGPLPFDWRRNYAIHLWWSHYLSIKKYTYEPNEEAIKSLNNTFAQIGRMILYGTWCFDRSICGLGF